MAAAAAAMGETSVASATPVTPANNMIMMEDAECMIPPGYISNKDNFQTAVDRLNFIRDKIQGMEASRHKEVLRIIRASGATYSENTNGIFINISILNNATLGEIEKFIQITDDQDKILMSIEDEKEKLIQEHYETAESH
jgi:hypothetical protein